MEGVLNELSDFDDKGLVKCGEIVLSPKKNAFAFRCSQCKHIFLQMVIFARHVRLEHQVEANVIEQYKQELLQDFSVYTVEELLGEKYDSGLSHANSTIDTQLNVGGGASSLNTDSDDTGIESDEELEKQISALLASIATSDSLSLTGTEFSDDSGLDTKNITDDSRSESQQEDQSRCWEKQAVQFKGEQDAKVIAKQAIEVEVKQDTKGDVERTTELNGERDTKVRGNLETKTANKHTRSTTTALRSGSKTDSAPDTHNTKDATKERNLSLQLKQRPESNTKHNQKLMDYAKPNTITATCNIRHKKQQQRKPTSSIKKQIKHARKHLHVKAAKRVKVLVEEFDAKFDELQNELAIELTDEPELFAGANYEEELSNLNDAANYVNVAKSDEKFKNANEQPREEPDIDVNDEIERITGAKYQEENKEPDIDVNVEIERITGAKCGELQNELDIDVDDEVERITGTKNEELHKETDIDVNYEDECITDAKSQEHNNVEIERITGANCEELHEEQDNALNDELGLTDQTEEMPKEMEADLSDELHFAREAEEQSYVTDVALPGTSDFESMNTSTELEQTDELTGIKFSREDLDDMKTGMPEILDSTNELEKIPYVNGLSAYQMQYLVYNETHAQLSAALDNNDDDKSTTSAETDVATPIDLSLNKSTDFADMQSGNISEKLVNEDAAAQCKITSDILIEVENLLAQQDTAANFNDYSAPSYDTNELLPICGSMDNRRLPPFSKFFKNTANSLRTSNGWFAQSTPKQKPLKASIKNKQTKIASPLRPSAQLNIDKKEEDVFKCTERVNNAKHLSEQITTKKSIRFPILKRALQSNEKESETKRRKIDNAIQKKEDCVTRKQRLEILKVEVLPPNATIADKSELDLKNSKVPGIKQATNNIKWDAATMKNIEDDLIPYVKIKKPTAAFSAHVAADSTSENYTTSFNELNYTPEETLNQLKLEQYVDEKPSYDSLLLKSFAEPLNSSIITTEESSFIRQASEEDKENYRLLEPLGLQIIVHPKAEDGMTLNTLETNRAKASLFATIYTEFRYLWKVNKGTKSYETMELDFIKLMQRINENFKLDLTIIETKRISNLISLWYSKSYSRALKRKRQISASLLHYLRLFIYLPKTTRRIFYCEECPRYFLTQQVYLAHRDKHLALPSTCPYCQTNFPSRKDLLQHTKICITFLCIECDSMFDKAADLEHHLRQKHFWQCEKCGRLAAQASDLETHVHEYPIICGLCNHLFDTAAELQNHRQDTFHWDYTCNICEILLPTATKMKNHSMLCKRVSQ